MSVVRFLLKQALFVFSNTMNRLRLQMDAYCFLYAVATKYLYKQLFDLFRLPPLFSVNNSDCYVVVTVDAWPRYFSTIQLSAVPVELPMWWHHKPLPSQTLYSLVIGTIIHTLFQATVSFVVSVRLSVIPHKPLGSHFAAFHEILYLRIVCKYVRKCKFHFNLTRITDTLHEDIYICILIVLIVAPCIS